MSYRDELYALLARPEHIDAALEIEGALPNLRALLRRRVWEALHENLRSGENVWRLEGIEDIRKNLWKKWAGLQFVSGTRMPSHLGVGVWQEGTKLYYGIAFSAQQEEPHPVREVRELKVELEQSIGRSQAPTDWHVWWDWTNCELDVRNFLVAAATDPQSVAAPIADLVLTLLNTHRKTIAIADNALAEWSGQQA